MLISILQEDNPNVSAFMLYVDEKEKKIFYPLDDCIKVLNMTAKQKNEVISKCSSYTSIPLTHGCAECTEVISGRDFEWLAITYNAYSNEVKNLLGLYYIPMEDKKYYDTREDALHFYLKACLAELHSKDEQIKALTNSNDK